MPSVEVNGLTIEFAERGTGPPLLLIMGLGGQLTDWPEPFVAELATRFRVVSFDNRDSGLSDAAGHGAPGRLDLLRAALLPQSSRPAYGLDDMADDAAGLLEALNIDRAHIVGMSMGAMIAQLLACRHPARVASLCSIMSHTGDRRRGLPTVRVVAELLRRADPDVDDPLEAALHFFELVGGADWNREDQRRRTESSLRRAFNPDGVLRQTLAILAATDRSDRLRQVQVPTLVVHGLDDPLIRPSGGIATAKAVAGSRLVMYPGMGHDLPTRRHRELAEEIATNTQR